MDEDKLKEPDNPGTLDLMNPEAPPMELGACDAATEHQKPDIRGSNNNNWDSVRSDWLTGGPVKRPCQEEPTRNKKYATTITYDMLQAINKPFPHPVPLAAVVECLVELWEEEEEY